MTALPDTERGTLGDLVWFPVRRGDSINRFLWDVHANYKDLKAAGKAADPVALKFVKDEVHHLLEKRGQREPFAAMLDTGFVLADAGNSLVPYARDTTNKSPYGRVDWESKRFRDEEGPLNFSFGGNFGVGPAQTLVKVQDESQVRTLHQDAFIWSAFARASRPLGSGAEIGPLVRFGQTQLTSMADRVGSDSDPKTTTTIANGTGRSATFVETGVFFNLFNAETQRVYEEKSYLAPVFTAGAGFRRDNRFRRDGDISGYYRPESRWFARFSVSLTNVLNRRPADGDPSSYDIGFTVDYDTPMGGGSGPGLRVPASTRIIINAGFDLLATLKRNPTANAAGN